MQLTETGKRIVSMKYSQGGELWEGVALRVASFIADIDKQYGATEDEVTLLTNKFYQAISKFYFLPGGRILANANTGITNLFNCFSLPISDSRQSIYQTLMNAAEVFAHGGGCGYNFSHIREKGARINSTGGQASGPLSFASLFDQTGEVIQQASRRGAQIMILNDSHPDIMEFIDFKSVPNSRNQRLLEEYDGNLKTYANGKLKNTKYYDVLEKTLLDDQLTHFNVSVLISDEFMNAVENDEDWNLYSVTDPTLLVRTFKARDIFNRIAFQSWKSGEPGTIFRNAINLDNMVPYIGTIESSNPCAEAPLLDNEACDLGSINLAAFYDADTNSIDFTSMEEVVRLATRFLDNVHDASTLPLEAINAMSKGLRRLGLGVFGWADLLAELGLAYDSEDAFNLGEYISWFISFFAWQESIELAKQRGAFPYYDKNQVDLHVVEKILNSKFNPYKFDMNEIREQGVRNVSVTAIAPTGTLPLLPGVCSAVEPFFALAYRRHITEGVGNVAKQTIVEINPILFRKLKQLGLSDTEFECIKEKILKSGSIQNIPEIPESIRIAFRTAHDLDWRAHLRMQAAWQNYVTNATSKTVNLNHDATEEDVRNVFMEAWKLKVKGVTIYRDGSRSFQILNSGV